MLPWSRLEGAGAWRPGRRGQTEPIAALVAVLAIGIGIGLYAGVAADQESEPASTDAESTMERLAAAAIDDGVLDPVAAMQPWEYVRPGEAANVTIRVGGSEYSAGPVPPAGADATRRPVTVRTGPGEGQPGLVLLEVWET